MEPGPANSVSQGDRATAHLDIALLGTFRVTRDSQPVSEPTYAKVLALLAFLAVESDRPHQRASIAAMLWPEQPEERARHSLRQALSTLRRVVGQETGAPCLLVSRDTVAFNREGDHDVDVEELAALLVTCARHDHADPIACLPCAERRERAVALYRGEFLEGFSIGDSESFESWVVMWRQRLHDQVMRALDDLASHHDRLGHADSAIRTLRRQLDLDPWLESGHRRLMTLLWQSGNRSAALAQYERCRRLLDEELGVEPEDETAALYRSIRDGATSPARPAATARPPALSTGLPATSTRLVGREREMGEIADLLAQRDCRLLTLTGPGGVGKTRLAIQVATELSRGSDRAACFVQLAPVRHHDGIALAIAQALAIQLQGSSQPEEQLLGSLRDRRLLLVLDSMEHLPDGFGMIASILEVAADVKVVVTSRERLGLTGEWVYEVRGLAFPRSIGSDTFEGYDAVELLRERLRQVRSGMPLPHEERPNVIRICQLVDGMPLALELAAAWASTLSLGEIADGISHNLDFLSSAARDKPDRHRSMRAVFTSSWAMLSPLEQATYRRLSVFSDGFRMDAAEQVAGATVERLAALINKSLLTRQPSGRYHFHGLLAQFGDELLRREADEYHDYHDRHCRHYLGVLAGRGELLSGRDQRAALRAIEEDIGNIRAAWAWAVEHHLFRELGAAGPAYWQYHVMHGSMREGASTFGAVIDTLGSQAASTEHQNPEWQLAVATARVHTGGFFSGLGRYDDGIVLLNQGIATLREHSTGRNLGLALNMLAAALSMKGMHEQARAWLRESLREFEQIGDTWGTAFSLNDLGMIAHQHFGDPEGQQLCERSRVMFRQVGDARGQALAAYNLGVIATERGELRRASHFHREAYALREECDDQWGIAASLVQLGMVARLTGSPDTAREQVLRALRIAWESSVVPVVLDALIELAELDMEASSVDRAQDALAAIACHPALNGQARARVGAHLAAVPELAVTPGRNGDTDLWAVRTVDDLARSLVG